MTLIYASYPLLDKEGPPDWVNKLANSPIPKAEQWAIYNPFLGFESNMENIATMAAVAGREPRITAEQMAHLKLDPALASPFSEVVQRLRLADQLPSIDVTFKSLYVLVRADLVLVDLNQQGHGEPSQEVLYAYLCGVPIVGIAHRFMLSPWMADKVNAVIFPKSSDDIVRQVLAHDHKTTATINYYRLAEVSKARRAKQTKTTADEMQELKERVDTLRDVAAETKRAADEKARKGQTPPEQEEDGGESGASTVQ